MGLAPFNTIKYSNHKTTALKNEIIIVIGASIDDNTKADAASTGMVVQPQFICDGYNQGIFTIPTWAQSEGLKFVDPTKGSMSFSIIVKGQTSGVVHDPFFEAATEAKIARKLQPSPEVAINELGDGERVLLQYHYSESEDKYFEAWRHLDKIAIVLGDVDTGLDVEAVVNVINISREDDLPTKINLLAKADGVGDGSEVFAGMRAVAFDAAGGLDASMVNMAYGAGYDVRTYWASKAVFFSNSDEGTLHNQSQAGKTFDFAAGKLATDAGDIDFSIGNEFAQTFGTHFYGDGTWYVTADGDALFNDITGADAILDEVTVGGNTFSSLFDNSDRGGDHFHGPQASAYLATLIDLTTPVDQNIPFDTVDIEDSDLSFSSFAVTEVNNDPGGGDVRMVSAGNDFVVGEIINVTGMTDAAYNGLFPVIAINAGVSFDVTAVYTADDTGDASSGAINIGTSARYEMGYNIDVKEHSTGDRNINFDCYKDLQGTPVQIVPLHILSSLRSTKWGPAISKSYILDLTAGDRINVTTTASTGNIRIGIGSNFTIKRAK